MLNNKDNNLQPTVLNNARTESKEVNVYDLIPHPFLLRYGLDKPHKFELREWSRFDLPPGEIIATEKNIVLFNQQALEMAKRLKLKKVKVTVLSGIEEDEFIQVIALKNMRKNLTRYKQAELIIELREYLKDNPYGKIWKGQIPGDNIVMKIGYLLGYSYGMINQIERIYKYNSDLLKKIDDGEKTITEAIAELPTSKSEEPLEEESNIEEGDQDDEDTEGGEDEKDIELDEDDEDTEGENSDNEPCEPPVPGTTPVKNSGPKSGFAGQKQMVSCERIAGITITYASGRTLNVSINDKVVMTELDGTALKPMLYSNPLVHPVDKSEYHVIADESGKTGMQVIFWNINSQAA